MSQIIISPSKYVQGAGEISKLSKYTQPLGTKVMVFASNSGIKRVRYAIEEGYKNSESSVVFQPFEGECSQNEIKKLQKICKENKIDVVMGVGGGKTLDTAKAVAHNLSLPVVIVPTIASTDAPCSALSVIYTDEGEFESYFVLPKNPDVVVMDTDIIAKAPARLLVSGMGDALATYFEARASIKTNSSTMAGGKATRAGFALAKLCFDTLITEGYKAKLSAQNQCVTPALEAIIEANTLLSGIGFESGGLAGAHAIHNGFTVLEECHHLYHGEKVAFGTISQLVIENSPMEEIKQVIQFCKSVGLPTTLSELGIKNVNKDDIMKVAVAASVKEETIHNMVETITPELVYAAIMTADELGKNLA